MWNNNKILYVQLAPLSPKSGLFWGKNVVKDQFHTTTSRRSANSKSLIHTAHDHRLPVAFKGIQGTRIIHKRLHKITAQLRKPPTTDSNPFHHYRSTPCSHSICCGPVSVRLSQAGMVPKCLKVESHKQRCTTDRHSSFLMPQTLLKFDDVTPKSRQNTGRVGWNRLFSSNISLYLRNGAT